jgi:catechol 2,3-dioxygenase-like lactoylglutathione lyase family enzyme
MDLMTSGNRNNAALGARLQGVQHFGLTVENMDRAFEFYTEVLGGSEVMRDGDFAAKGARTIEDMRPIVDPNSNHPTVLDTIKQIALYTDCYGDAHWSGLMP